MADDEKGTEVTSTRGADWEVVSLTASTYAAAPGPEGFNADEDRKDGDFSRNEEESPDAMFMSRHFVFPPSEHENLPIEPEYEIHRELEVQDVSVAKEEGGDPDKCEEETTLSKSDGEPHGIHLFDSGSNLSFTGMEVDEDLIRQSHTGSSDITESNDPSHEQDLNSPSKNTKPSDEGKYDGSGLPCEAWWKRHAASLYHSAKETNTLWSLFVAAALMGLVILGRRWQQEKWHLQQLKLKLGINEERLSWMLGSIGRFKDVLVGGHHRSSPQIRGGAAANR